MLINSYQQRCAVLYGAGLAQFFFTSPIKVTKNNEAITSVKITNAPAHTEHKTIKPSLTTAQSMLDVD